MGAVPRTRRLRWGWASPHPPAPPFLQAPARFAPATDLELLIEAAPCCMSQTNLAAEARWPRPAPTLLRDANRRVRVHLPP